MRLQNTFKSHKNWKPLQRNYSKIEDTERWGKNLPRKMMISDGYTGNRQSCPSYRHLHCWRCPFPVPDSPPINHHLTFTTLQIDGFTLVPWGNDIHFAKPGSWCAIKDNLSPLQIIARSVGFSPQLPPQPILVSLGWIPKSKHCSFMTKLLSFLVNRHWP